MDIGSGKAALAGRRAVHSVWRRIQAERGEKAKDKEDGITQRKQWKKSTRTRDRKDKQEQTHSNGTFFVLDLPPLTLKCK